MRSLPVRPGDITQLFDRSDTKNSPPRLPVRLQTATYVQIHGVRLYLFGVINLNQAYDEFLQGLGELYVWSDDDALRPWLKSGDECRVIVKLSGDDRLSSYWVACLNCEPLPPLTVDLMPNLRTLVANSKFVPYHHADERPERPKGRASISRSIEGWTVNIYLTGYDPNTITDAEIVEAMSHPETAKHTSYPHDHDDKLTVVEILVVTKLGNSIFITGSVPTKASKSVDGPSP